MPDPDLAEDWKNIRPYVKHTCLLDLPVLPEHRDEAASTDIVQTAYLAELEALKSPDDLKSFVQRWMNVWLLWNPRDENREIPAEIQSLLYLDSDAEAVFKYLQLKSQVEPPLPFETDVNVRIMAHLAIPVGLLEAFQLAHHYHVGQDLGLVRLFLDPYPEHAEKLR
jgi:hypothetical protein